MKEINNYCITAANSEGYTSAYLFEGSEEELKIYIRFIIAKEIKNHIEECGENDIDMVSIDNEPGKAIKRFATCETLTMLPVAEIDYINSHTCYSIGIVDEEMFAVLTPEQEKFVSKANLKTDSSFGKYAKRISKNIA